MFAIASKPVIVIETRAGSCYGFANALVVDSRFKIHASARFVRMCERGVAGQRRIAVCTVARNSFSMYQITQRRYLKPGSQDANWGLRMITYLYWGLVIGLVIATMIVVGIKLDNLKAALVITAVILVAGWGAYYFHFQQVFVKRYGGVMTVTVPDGQHHISATWKDDNLWIENYDPATNTCQFNEYSRGNLLQGRVTIKNCSPLMPKQAILPTQ